MEMVEKGSTQIIFIGGTWDAANDSFLQFKGKDLRRVIGIYGDEKSKENWLRLREKILAMGLLIDGEYEADYEDINSILLTLQKIYGRSPSTRRVVNITGLSKMGSIGAFVYYALLDDTERKDLEFTWLTLKGKQVVLFPQIVFSMAEENSKRGRKRTVSWEILKYLSCQPERSATLTQLAENLDKKRAKPTILEAVDRLEHKKLVARVRLNRESIFILNEFAYELMKYFKEKKEKKYV